jgi:hypothetical protein
LSSNIHKELGERNVAARSLSLPLIPSVASGARICNWAHTQEKLGYERAIYGWISEIETRVNYPYHRKCQADQRIHVRHVLPTHQSMEEEPMEAGQ